MASTLPILDAAPTPAAVEMLHRLVQNTSSPVPSENGQEIVDLMFQLLLRKDFQRVGLSDNDRQPLKAALRHICHAHNLLPSSLLTHGVKIQNKYAFGGGFFADIFRGQYRGNKVAIKRLRIATAFDLASRHKMYLQREALIWSLLSHDHILPFHGVDLTLFNPPTLSLVLPWMDNGNLQDYLSKLRRENRPGLQDLIHRWMYQIALGLEYLHAEDIVHADLRGPNILVDDHEKIRVADFGLARLAIYQANTMTSGEPTNGHWAAPELIAPEYYGFQTRMPTKNSDVYSFGCLCIEMYTSQKPPNISLFQIIQNIDFQLPRPTFCVNNEDMPDPLWSMIKETRSIPPLQRPPAANIVVALRGFFPAHALDSTSYDLSTTATQPPAALSSSPLDNSNSHTDQNDPFASDSLHSTHPHSAESPSRHSVSSGQPHLPLLSDNSVPTPSSDPTGDTALMLPLNERPTGMAMLQLLQDPPSEIAQDVIDLLHKVL